MPYGDVSSTCMYVHNIIIVEYVCLVCVYI